MSLNYVIIFILQYKGFVLYPMNVIENIRKAISELMMEGIRPSLLVIGENHERLLFTECGVPKNISAEEFILEEFKLELFVLSTHKVTEPTVYGSYITGEDCFSMGFVKWYSGMKEKQITRSHDMWKIENNQGK